MYLLKDKHTAYWMYTDDRATSTLHSKLKEAFLEFTLEDHIWDPSDKDANVRYEVEGNFFIGYDVSNDKKLERNAYHIVAKLPTNCTYKQFITLHPELFI